MPRRAGPPMSVRGLRHTGIVVRRMAPALRFWRALGFRLRSRAVEEGPFISGLVGMPGVRIDIAKLDAPGGGMVELLEYLSHPGARAGRRRANAPGVHHLALTVKDVDALCRRLKKAGFKPNAAPALSVDGRVKVVYLHGPDGLVLELVTELAR